MNGGIKMTELTEEELEGIEGISCYHCGKQQDLFFNHNIEDYAYRQVTCMPCLIEWVEEQAE
jgi:hypothetical protein